ncbi:MAG: ester cyclase [Candidatus Omnitrophica bacterium]|nr:ester cyclase [Candidatus Omnitrophota bacterium]
MNLTDPKTLINYFINEVINRRNLDAIDAIVDENFIEHVPFPGQGPGREGLKETIAMMVRSFPDLVWMVDEQIVQDTKVVSRFAWTGTHKGEFLGIPATGKTVCVWGVVIDVVKDGLFKESRIIMDVPGLLQQLGKG